ncbi:hypothetical protein BDZ97DRAFT_1814929 [Flammula alnicola]|nr:hypothetical protein BDZ97DRAFT_1814929 [Flammula alnicola]
MGNSASKAARKYPSRAQIPSQPVSRNGAKASLPEPAVQSSKLAHSHRSEAIENDAADPDFISNLNRLGPVRVDHHMQAIHPQGSNPTRLFESRAKSELSSEPTKNQLYAFKLSDLLDRRKDVRSRQDMEKLSDEFGIETDKLESLARFVSSPSIDSATIRPVGGKSEEEGFMATAVWIEPQFNRPS